MYPMFLLPELKKRRGYIDLFNNFNCADNNVQSDVFKNC